MKAAQSERPGWRFPPASGLPLVAPGRKVRVESVLRRIYGTTKIQWTDHTANFWIGCERVSPGCRECYAEKIAARFTPGIKHYAPGCPVVDKPNAFETMRRLNRRAAKGKFRSRVFASSMTDIFWEKAGESRLAAVRDIIAECDNLDFQILTKRVERAVAVMARPVWRDLENVWLGVSVEDQPRAVERIPILRAAECNAPVLFLSVEPLIGEVDLGALLAGDGGRKIDWVIIGGESGPRARPMSLSWAASAITAATAAGAAVFVKQLGARPMSSNGEPLNFRDRKGGDIDEWPPQLQIRDFPKRSA